MFKQNVIWSLLLCRFQMPPNKVCLSEEKVAQQLQELSIDPNSCLSRNKSCGISSEDKDRHMPYKHPGNWRGINSEAERCVFNFLVNKPLFRRQYLLEKQCV